MFYEQVIHWSEQSVLPSLSPRFDSHSHSRKISTIRPPGVQQFKQCSLHTHATHFSLVTGRKSSNLCVKRILDLPMFKSILHYRFCRRMVYSLLPKVTWYYRQHLEHRLASDFSVILCNKKNKNTCNLHCPSGAAILIPDFWNLHIRASFTL